MRHKVGHRKLQRSTGHRTALLRNLAASLIKHEQILTTTPKAKELRPYVEKLITLAKKGGLSNRRLADARLKDDAQLTKLFEVLAERYKDRNGGSWSNSDFETVTDHYAGLNASRISGGDKAIKINATSVGLNSTWMQLLSSKTSGEYVKVDDL